MWVICKGYCELLTKQGTVVNNPLPLGQRKLFQAGEDSEAITVIIIQF